MTKNSYNHPNKLINQCSSSSCNPSNSYKDFFVNFSNKTKLDIIVALRNKSLCVNEIAEKIGQEQSKVSHSLNKLARCKILDVKQDGKKRVYSLNTKTVLPIMQIVEQHVHKYCAKNCPLECIKKHDKKIDNYSCFVSCPKG